MKPTFNYFQLTLAALVLALAFLAGAFFIPWQNVDWGKIQLSPSRTITVVGEAKTKEKSQIATFTAGVSAVNDNKDAAIEEVNQKIKTIIDSVKNFGIKEEDIKTQNLSIYQNEETYYEEGVQKRRFGQWRVSNSIRVTLRDVDRASDLADLLSRSGATNVQGPNFTVEETQPAQEGLLGEAIENAQEKAEIIARSSGSRLGKIISISETSQPVSAFRGIDGMGGGGSPLEPGVTEIGKAVTVVFELK